MISTISTRVGRLVPRKMGNFRFLAAHNSSRLSDQFNEHQKSLPALPVPSLSESLNKFLDTLHPLVSSTEYLQTQKAVEEFAKPNGEGELLNKLLMKRSEKIENWLSDWWLQLSYLQFRMPLIVFSSPGLIFPLQKFNSKDDQLKYASKLIVAALNFKSKIDGYSIPLEKAGKAPLDMSQYFKIFSTCRIPRFPSDQLMHYDLESPQHIIVCHNNHYYKVNVFTEAGTLLNEAQVHCQLKTILKLSSSEEGCPIGVMSADHRDKWAENYELLCKNPKNKTSLQAIHEALFVLCLDKEVPQDLQNNKLSHAGLQTIHGGGAKLNSGNRWFDKTIQFIIGETGVVGMTYEHSPAEGPPIANLMNYIVENMDNSDKLSGESEANLTQEPQKLSFEISNDVSEAVAASSSNIEKLINDLQLCAFSFIHYGREFIKLHKMSPDSYIQMAIQLAFYRLHNAPGATYESASTRMFIHGRTETIRSCSKESLEFCKTWLDPSIKNEDKALSFRKAVAAHKKYALEAGQGLGVDRHFLGLKKLAGDSGLDTPQLFKDPGYIKSCHFRLSTSQVPSTVDALMVYGPLVDNGYGCCYNPLAHTMNFGVSAFNNCSETDAKKFQEALETSLMELFNIFSRLQTSKL